jgi:hypothetical protein
MRAKRQRFRLSPGTGCNLLLFTGQYFGLRRPAKTFALAQSLPKSRDRNAPPCSDKA